MFSREIWQEIEGIFWREGVPCLPDRATDGIGPEFIETTKRGVEISGVMWFLPTGRYQFSLCLSRPWFSSMESVTISKLRRTTILDCCFEGQTLSFTVGGNK
jgi:hypothetical protein